MGQSCRELITKTEETSTNHLQLQEQSLESGDAGIRSASVGYTEYSVRNNRENKATVAARKQKQLPTHKGNALNWTVGVLNVLKEIPY